MMKAKILTQANYQTLLKHSTLIEGCENKPRVLKTENDLIVKFFHTRKKHFSSSFFKPYAKRFVNNAKQLLKRGVLTANVNDFYYFNDMGCYVATYPMLPGDDLRQKIDKGESEILIDFAAFLAELHKKGIYFRGLHLGNVIYSDKQGFGLIDITDVTLKQGMLSQSKREKNLQHLFNNKTDAPLLKTFGVDRFMKAYEEAMQ